MTRVASPCRLPGVSTACLLVGTLSITPEPGRAQLSGTCSDLLAAWVSAMRCWLVTQSRDSGVPAPPSYRRLWTSSPGEGSVRIPRNSEAMRCVQGRQQSFSQASCHVAVRETRPAAVEACGSLSSRKAF